MNFSIIRAVLLLSRTLCVVGFGAFCLITLIQVVNRYALGFQIFWTEEVAVLLFVWSVMIGLPVALWDRQEIAVDLFSLPEGRSREWLKGSADLVSFAFLILLSFAGAMLMARAGNALTPALGIPRWWSYLSIPVGSLLGAFMLIARRIGTYASLGIKTDKDDVNYAHD